VGLHYVGGVHTGDIAPSARPFGLEGGWTGRDDPDGFDTLRFPRPRSASQGLGPLTRTALARLPGDGEALTKCVRILEGVARQLRTVDRAESKLDYVRFPFRAGKVVAWGMRPLTDSSTTAG
jgi:hypothetical protein